MGRAAVAITFSASERRELDGLARRRKTAQGLARRARIVLAAADGLENKAIVDRVGADANTVGKWRRRFAEHRLDGLYDEPRSGAPRTIDDQRIAEIIGLTLEETPPDGTHWSLRSMARASGYAPSTIHRIWRAFGLQPHRSETFKLSADPLFVDKVRDIVGLYLDPPERALVLCVDEKSQIQALDRSRPLLPCGPDRSSGAPTTTRATGPPRSSRPWTSPPARSSGSASRAIAAGSSSSSCALSKPGSPTTSTSIW